ncbi:hypothetical protein GCM10023322_75770 [Rugosimonospora acidiphila]|uniref:Uncharacterized protein n=1 Tax=Rugosimonospora acidiphila TaxID=556531 RepID=A0ABP9SPQ5_9ACTN
MALVVEPQPAGASGTSALDGAADAIATAVRAGTDADRIRIINMTSEQMSEAFRDDDIYGAVVIPAVKMGHLPKTRPPAAGQRGTATTVPGPSRARRPASPSHQRQATYPA